MADYEIHVHLKNVGEGDATDLAQEIYDANADDYDAKNGEFDVSVHRVESSSSKFETDWSPAGDDAA